MTIMPLVVANVIVAIAATPIRRSAGRLGGLLLVTFVAMLLAGGVAALVLVTALLSVVPPDSSALEGLRLDVGTTDAVVPDRTRATATMWGGLATLLPANPIRAAADGDLLGVIAFSVVFGLAVSRLPNREPIVALCQATTAAMLIVVRWVLVFAPIGVFALAFAATARLGVSVISAVSGYLALLCGVLLGMTAALYGVAVVVGRVPLGAFARAVAPAQAVALGTRSSLASLPALLEGARRHLPVPSAVSGFTLPLSVAVFKANRTISSTVTLMFLARVYGLSPDPVFLTGFLLFVMMASFSTPGTPGGGQLLTLPGYLASGIPLEPLLLLGAVEALPDVFKTLLNVTANMTATAIVGRFAGVPHDEAAVAVTDPTEFRSPHGSATAAE
jgi:Na+/H+-dicarboxylate symporter